MRRRDKKERRQENDEEREKKETKEEERVAVLCPPHIQGDGGRKSSEKRAEKRAMKRKIDIEKIGEAAEIPKAARAQVCVLYLRGWAGLSHRPQTGGGCMCAGGPNPGRAAS